MIQKRSVMRSWRHWCAGLASICIIDPAASIAQTRTLDSLAARLSIEGRTAQRVDMLLERAYRLVNTYSDSLAAAQLEEAVTLAHRIGYAEGMAHGPMREAFRLLREGGPAKAIVHCQRSISMLDALKVGQGLYSPLAFIRYAYNAAGLQQDRLEFYQAALERYSRGGPRKSLIPVHHGLGGYYMFSGQYPQAIEHYLKARELLAGVHAGDAANESMVIGWCYQRWGNLGRAMQHFQEALTGLEREQEVDLVNTVNCALGDIDLASGDTAAGLLRYLDTRAYWHRLEPLSLGVVRSRLVVAFLGTGEQDSAATHLALLNRQHAREPLQLNAARGECEVDWCNYRYHRAIGENDTAFHWLMRAAAKARDAGQLPLLMKYRKELARCLAERGDMSGSAREAQAYIRMSDSLRNVENSSAVAAYESQAKERESALELTRREGQLRTQRIALASGACGLLLVVALTFTIHRGKRRSDELLLNILPKTVADELKAHGAAQARHFDTATILFTDFKGFTQLSEQVTPAELVEELNSCFKVFDGIMGKYRIEKIKTIGDAYMAAGGLPDPYHGSPADVVRAALEMQDFMQRHKAERDAAGKPFFEMRVGIHTGPVVAGIVGVKKFQYDIWGDTVNTASRMESSGEVGKANISEATYALVREQAGPLFDFTPRGKVQAKGKGEMEMYFVERSAGAA